MVIYYAQNLDGNLPEEIQTAIANLRGFQTYRHAEELWQVVEKDLRRNKVWPKIPLVEVCSLLTYTAREYWSLGYSRQGIIEDRIVIIHMNEREEDDLSIRIERRLGNSVLRTAEEEAQHDTMSALNALAEIHRKQIAKLRLKEREEVIEKEF